jgi:multiple sugar transport system substrate-binding protein/raffinose/stachyose/melibiose transport system substrate-binding protein
VVAASACGAAGRAATTPAPVHIQYNSYQSDSAPRAFTEGVVADWNAQHPEQPVDLSITAHEDFKQAIRAYLTAQPAPDVLDWFAGNRARFFVERGLIRDVSDLWQANGFNQSFGPVFRDLSTFEGRQYFLPSSTYWWAIYYRPSLFAQAGIEQPPQTWDALLAACDRLNAIGVTPFTIGTRAPWPAAAWFDYINMRLNGPEFHTQVTDLQVPYTDPRVRAVFDYWRQLFDHQCFIDDPAAYDWQEAVTPMAQGQAAMFLMGAFFVGSYPDELENDLDFFRFPVITPGVPIGEDAPTNGYFMPLNAGHPDAALRFLAYLGSKEVQQRMLDELGRLPTRIDVDLSQVSPATQKGIDLIQSADYVAQFYDRDTPEPMAQAGMAGFVRFWTSPDEVDAILADLEAERQRVLAEEVQ